MSVAGTIDRLKNGVVYSVIAATSAILFTLLGAAVIGTFVVAVLRVDRGSFPEAFDLFNIYYMTWVALSAIAAFGGFILGLTRK